MCVQVTFFPAPPAHLQALSAKCTVYASSAFAVALSAHLASPAPPFLQVRVDRPAGRLTITRTNLLAGGLGSSPGEDGALGTAAEWYRLPEGKQGLGGLGLGREETELVRWVVREVGREAGEVLEGVRRGRERRRVGAEASGGKGAGGIGPLTGGEAC